MQIHIIRLTFFRLLNHWGYDVVMYDSDAVVLKNPQPLFDANQGVELVGSAGKGPENIGHVWGRTICTGVLLLRTSPGLGMYRAIGLYRRSIINTVSKVSLANVHLR